MEAYAIAICENNDDVKTVEVYAKPGLETERLIGLNQLDNEERRLAVAIHSMYCPQDN